MRAHISRVRGWIGDCRACEKGAVTEGPYGSRYAALLCETRAPRHSKEVCYEVTSENEHVLN